MHNNNEVMAENPDQWVEEDFEDWIDLGKPKSIANFTPEQKRQDELRKEYARRDLSISTAAATTTTTAPEIVSDEEVVSNVNVVTKRDDNSNLNVTDDYE